MSMIARDRASLSHRIDGIGKQLAIERVLGALTIGQKLASVVEAE